MSRYIDADALMEDARRDKAIGACLADIVDVQRLVDEQPTVDAVPVVWKSVKGFEGLYEISTTGKVRNAKGETLKQRIKRTPCTCYKLVSLWKDGGYHTKYIHRLIAEAFIPNPNGFEFINHKDEDGTNNAIENLEWCTREYNVNYGTARKRQAAKLKGRESEKRISVLQYSLDGEFMNWYPSITEAAKDCETSTGAISAACNGKRKTAKGYTWKYDCPNCGAYMRERE